MPEPGVRTTVQLVTDDGIPVPAVTTDMTREVDQIAIEATGPALLQMIKNMVPFTRGAGMSRTRS